MGEAPKGDRVLTDAETEEFMAACYLDGLEKDYQDTKDIVEAQAHKILHLQDYIKIMERVAEDREQKVNALERTLELLETELNKIR